MQILSRWLFSRKILTPSAWHAFRKLVGIALLLALTAGCSEAPLTARQIPALVPIFTSNADFQIRVTLSARKGVYTVTGKTNLPNNSSVAVAAIRYLQLKNPKPQHSNPKPTYSILAYRDDVKVNQGEWKTDLELWKIAPDGKIQEEWQLEQAKLGIALDPSTEVIFLATLAPTDSLAEIEQQLERRGINLVSSLIRSTVEGERYVQASQVLPVALPTGKTAPPLQQAEDVNGGWGPRYLLLPEPPNITNLERPDQRRTNAPLSPKEFL